MNLHMDSQRLEQATRDRLAQLAKRPVDTASIERRLEEALEHATSRRRLMFPMLRWGSLAAAILLLLTLVFIWNGSQRPVLAASTMAELHEDIVAGRAAMVSVSNAQEAREVIESAWEGGPSLPTVEMPVESCCLEHVKDRRVACLLFRDDGIPITIVIARADDFQSASKPQLMRNGNEYHVTSSDGVNMVMVNDDQRWLCFMSSLSSDRLVEIADAIIK